MSEEEPYIDIWGNLWLVQTSDFSECQKQSFINSLNQYFNVKIDKGRGRHWVYIAFPHDVPYYREQSFKAKIRLIANQVDKDNES